MPANQLGPEHVEDMREGLTAFVAKTRDFLNPLHGQPNPGSMADVENQSASRPESIVTAWGIGALLIDFGFQHVAAFVRTLDDPASSIAAGTCVRSMLESCAMAAWLLDPTIDATKRISRVFARRYSGLDQQLKYGRSVGVPPSQIESEEKRIDALEATVVALGYPACRDKNGKRNGLCEVMPNATDMIENVLKEGGTYRLLSSVAHGHHMGILPLGYEIAGSAKTVGGVNVQGFVRTDNFAGYAWLGMCVLKSIARPLWNQCQYFGWDWLKLEEIIEDSADKLHAARTTDVRYWRTY